MAWCEYPTFLGHSVIPSGEPNHRQLLFRKRPKTTPSLAAADCWAPDYCKPETFSYAICKLRIRRRSGQAAPEQSCPEGQYCEEIDCAHKCFLPPRCWCETEAGPFKNRMLCEEGKCLTHPTSQWGICAPVPEGWQGDEDEPLPLEFHFYTEDELCASPCLHQR